MKLSALVLCGVVGLIANRTDEQRNERRSDDACWAPAAEQRRPMEWIRDDACCLLRRLVTECVGQ